MKPIIMSTEDVRAVLDGRKTMVRLSDNRMPHKPGDVLWVRETWKPQDYQFIDGMWNCAIVYKAGGMEGRVYWPDGTDSIYERCGIWRPSIHMPREAARLFLRVKDVRVERVQDITVEDALAEGIPDDLGFPMDKVYCPRCNGEGLIGSLDGWSLGYQEVDCPQCQTAKKRFANFWDARNAKRGYGWDSNPWVWVYTFEMRLWNRRTPSPSTPTGAEP